MEFKDILALRDNFVRIARQYTNAPEDVAQELLLKLWELHQANDMDRILIDGELNMSYIHKAIKNISHEQQIFERRRVDLPNDVSLYDDYTGLEVDVCLRKEHPYYKMLFIVYNELGDLRTVASKTKISYATVFKDLKHVKDKLKVLR